MNDLPQFTAEGLLPAGEVVLTLQELEQSILVDGPDDGDVYPGWDGAWRRKLFQNLGILVVQLRQVGITEIFVDGSFVEDKEHPNDIDGYFECELMPLASGQLCGIQDSHGNELTFPAAFRLSRVGKPKGVIKIGATS